MAKKLKDLVISKVALVPKGSNPDSDITLFKSDSVEKITFNEVITGHPEGVREALWKVYDLCWAFSNTVYANMSGGKNVMADMEKSLSQFEAAVKDALAEANITKGTKEAADTVQAAVIAKAREFLAKHQEAPVATTNTQQSKKREDMSKEELLAELDRVEKAQKTDTPDEADPAAVLKANPDLPEPVRKALEASAAAVAKAQETADAARADAARAETIAKEEKMARRVVEKIAFVKAEMKHIPGKPEDIAKSLIELEDKVSKEAYDMTIASMKAGSAAIAKTSEEVGGDDTRMATGSAFQKLQAHAEEIQKANPKLTKEQAFSKACDEHSDLYMEHRAEVRQSATH